MNTYINKDKTIKIIVLSIIFLFAQLLLISCLYSSEPFDANIYSRNIHEGSSNIVNMLNTEEILYISNQDKKDTVYQYNNFWFKTALGMGRNYDKKENNIQGDDHVFESMLVGYNLVDSVNDNNKEGVLFGVFMGTDIGNLRTNNSLIKSNYNTVNFGGHFQYAKEGYKLSASLVSSLARYSQYNNSDVFRSNNDLRESLLDVRLYKQVEIGEYTIFRPMVFLSSGNIHSQDYEIYQTAGSIHVNQYSNSVYDVGVGGKYYKVLSTGDESYYVIPYVELTTFYRMYDNSNINYSYQSINQDMMLAEYGYLAGRLSFGFDYVEKQSMLKLSYSLEASGYNIDNIVMLYFNLYLY